MIKVEVNNKIDKYNYVLVDDKSNKYKLNIEFLGTDIYESDILYINETLLNENNFYTFGKIRNNNVESNDILKIITNGKEILLERYYG